MAHSPRESCAWVIAATSMIRPWAARYNTELLIKLTQPFLSFSFPCLYESLLVFLQGMPAVRVLHNALGSPSAPQAAPAPITKAKTFQKAKSLLSFRHQGSTAASFGSNRGSMLPAAYPALPPGDPHQHLVLTFGILVKVVEVQILYYTCL